MPSVLDSSLTSHGVAHILLQLVIFRIENVVQFLGQTLCLRQLDLVYPSSDGRDNGKFTSYRSDIIDSTQFQNNGRVFWWY